MKRITIKLNKKKFVEQDSLILYWKGASEIIWEVKTIGEPLQYKTVYHIKHTCVGVPLQILKHVSDKFGINQYTSAEDFKP